MPSTSRQRARAGRAADFDSDDEGGSDFDDTPKPRQTARMGKQAVSRTKRAVVGDSDSEDEGLQETEHQPSSSRNRVRKRSVISEDDDEEVDGAGREGHAGKGAEEVSEEVNSEDEADMTIIDEALSPVKVSLRKSSPLIKRPKLNEEGEDDDSGDEVHINLPTTPTKSSSSDAEERIKALPPKTPDQRLLEVNRGLIAPPRPTMTPYTPRNPSMAPTPASQARTTIAPPTASTPPKIRLVIHKMVLRDFKSYAGEQIIGPFHKSFSAVVGPNGSGKSNVIDAMLFVFGWRANKMRQGKLSELIHNSAGRENLAHCSVEVWFREIVDLPGPDDFKVVPKSKLVVARTAYRNNSSVYTMNGKKSSFTEVTTLLKTRGIDLDHKRFLILQGEVESIAQMPPKAKTEHEEGLLEYLEDIIGTSSYKTPIEEASKKVDEANELRGERLGRLKIVQKERDSLEPRKREAEAYLRDQNELTQRQSALWQVYMLDCKDQMSIASTSMEKLNQRIEEEREKNAGSKAEIDTLEKGFKKINAEFDVAAKEHDKIAKELAKCEKDDVQLQEKRKHLETKKKKLTKAMSDDKHAMSEAKSALTNSTEEIDTLSKDLKKMEEGLEKEEAELDRMRESLKGKTEKFSIAIDQKQMELQPWISKISENENARKVATEERKLLTDQFGQAEKEASDAKKALKDLEESCEAKREELERLRNEKEQQMEKVKTYQEEIKGMEAQEQELRVKATASRVKCDEAKASMQNNRSRGDVLSSLSRQAELGMIKGFHGRLGNLGTIDDKYDVAISTACPGLDNIVVDGVEHGQACIEHLRKNNLGRANFILLNSLAKMNMGPIQTPDGVPRLFDLVQPRDSRFAPAFYHQLRDTLVARDLTHANKIAYGAQRWRVVTLDGQLIDKSGTMSGGGTKVARGAMSSKAFAQEVTLEQLSRFDKERMVNEDALQKQIKYTQDMRGMLDACTNRIPQIDMALDKIELDLGNSQRMIQEAQRRVKEIQQQQTGLGDGDAKRVKDLDKVVSALEGEIEKLKKTSTTIEADIAALQDKILEAGGVELRAQNSKVEGIKERIDLYNERMTKAEVTKTKADKDLIKLTKSTEKNAEALEGIEAEMQGLADEIASKSQSVNAIRQKVEQVQYDLESKKEARDEIKERLDGLMEGANAFRSLEVELKQKLEDDEKIFGDNERKLQHWEEKHSKLEMQQIDSDEDDEEAEAADAEANADNEQLDEDQDEVQNDQSAVRKGNKQRSRELQEYSPDELRSFNKENIKAEIATYEEKLQKGQGNLSVLQEYKKREQEFLARAKDLEATTQERDEAKRRHDDLRKQRLESFMAGFSVISSKLKEMYQTITLGGNAELELVDSLDPFSEGILFSVMPPKKSWKNISNLSGGEKTLSSLALVFALHAFKPTPLYAMDELDAALDFRNVSIVANLIKERTKGAQFIVISLRNNMFELASRLVGIYKTNGQTKSLAVHNTDLHALPAPPPPAPMTASRTMHAMTTPRPNMARGSVPPSMTTPALNQLSSIRRPALQTPARSFGSFNIASPVPPSFTQIPQTPKTGMIRGLGITGSSMKLTSSQSIRGDFASKYSQSQGTSGANSERSSVTPLAIRRPN